MPKLSGAQRKKLAIQSALARGETGLSKSERGKHSERLLVQIQDLTELNLQPGKKTRVRTQVLSRKMRCNGRRALVQIQVPNLLQLQPEEGMLVQIQVNPLHAKHGNLQWKPSMQCGEEEETASHVVFDCHALQSWRVDFIGTLDPREELIQNNLVKRLLKIQSHLDLA